MGRLVLRYKKSKNLLGKAYIQSSNANSRVLLNLSIFGWFLLFLVNLHWMIVCMPRLKGFWISYSVTLTSP